ncbi:hypothetical protein KEJ18_07540 [Candidatus Bathyarchaeota archaeon]|nr:hypothetical protein [Candidatus Bathyarchaeota archaeon]
MRKFERIYRELLLRSLHEVQLVRQEDIALKCEVSLGLVNKTVRKLEVAMAVEATRSGVRVLSPARLLNLWAAERDLGKDVWRSFRLDPIAEVEKNLPRDVLITGFSGWAGFSGRRPAEYDRLFFYVMDVESFELWFGFRKSRVRKVNPNVFVLYVDDEHLVRSSEKGVVCVPQLYVDIYSADGPEASAFLRDIALVYPSLSLW